MTLAKVGVSISMSEDVYLMHLRKFCESTLGRVWVKRCLHAGPDLPAGLAARRLSLSTTSV